jgi:hypothetical protein
MGNGYWSDDAYRAATFRARTGSADFAYSASTRPAGQRSGRRTPTSTRSTSACAIPG